MFNWLRKKEKPSKPKRKVPARFWQAGQGSTLTADWPMYGQHIDWDLRRGLHVLRARAKHEAQNNDHVAHFLRLCRTNIIGPHGIRYQSRIKNRRKNLDNRLNTALENAWKDWGRFQSPDVTARHSWRSLQNEFITTLARDGEAIYRKVRQWEGNSYGFALQAIDPETLDIRLNQTLPNGNRVVMGVEIDEWRRPARYYFTPERNYTELGQVTTKEHLIVPAADILHCFLPEWVWQTRGVPWVSTALLRMYELRGYEDAEVVAARVAASKMGFYIPNEDAGQFQGDGEGENGTDQDGNFIQDASPGEFEIAPYGYDIKSFDPQHPNSGYGDFVKSALRGIASGLGVDYNTLANDLEGVNYTSLRHGNLTQRDVWMMLQEWAVECFVQPVFDEWLRESLLRGRISIGSNPVPPERRTEISGASVWQPRRWAWVDPDKETKANRAQWEMRTKSISKIIREGGEDPDEVFAEIQQDNEKLEAMGIQVIQKDAQPATTEEPEDAGETEDNP